jgi:hypothetical protein
VAAGWTGIGVDLPAAELERAAASHPAVRFALASVLWLPAWGRTADLLDRDCFRYLPPTGRTRYAGEARRVLRPGGRSCFELA